MHKKNKTAKITIFLVKERIFITVSKLETFRFVFTILTYFEFKYLCINKILLVSVHFQGKTYITIPITINHNLNWFKNEQKVIQYK